MVKIIQIIWWLIPDYETDLAKYETVYSDIVNDDVDASAAMIKYVSETLWNTYGKLLPYESESDLEKTMIQYLYNQGRTVHNLMRIRSWCCQAQ